MSPGAARTLESLTIESNSLLLYSLIYLPPILIEKEFIKTIIQITEIKTCGVPNKKENPAQKIVKTINAVSIHFEITLSFKVYNKM